MAPPPFLRAVGFGAYEGELRGLIHLLKYDGMRSVAKGLGERLGRALLAIPELEHELIVIPVPLHRTKQRQRGFNHAELIARAAVKTLKGGNALRHPVLLPDALSRDRATESQASLSPRGRRRNLRGAFSVSQREQVRGRHLLLVDDIYTTGATARAASGALLRAGAASVWVATVARAQREGVALWDADATLGRELAPASQHESFARQRQTGTFQPEES